MEVLPAEIGQLTLQSLDLSGNRLQTLPAEPQVLIDDPITVGELAETVSRSPIDLMRILMKFGVRAPITQVIDIETASIICEELDIQIGLKSEQPEEPAKEEELRLDEDGSLKSERG